MEALGGAMAMHPSSIDPVPEETARVAWAAFRKGTLLMRVRDEIGVLYDDTMFATLYDARGQPAIAPWRMALVTLFSVPREPVRPPGGRGGA
jgi:transposase